MKIWTISVCLHDHFIFTFQHFSLYATSFHLDWHKYQQHLDEIHDAGVLNYIT